MVIPKFPQWANLITYIAHCYVNKRNNILVKIIIK